MKRNSKPVVFVVDDEPTLADSMADVFTASGYEAYAFYSTGSALQVALEVTPNLLVTDVMLSRDRINGIDLAIYFERFYPECEVLVISGHPATADLLARAEAAGHEFRFLAKPIHPRELLATAQELLTGVPQSRAS